GLGVVIGIAVQGQTVEYHTVDPQALYAVARIVADDHVAQADILSVGQADAVAGRVLDRAAAARRRAGAGHHQIAARTGVVEDDAVGCAIGRNAPERHVADADRRVGDIEGRARAGRDGVAGALHRHR